MQQQQQDNMKDWAEGAILEMQPDIGYGFFIVQFDNRKRRGRNPVKHYEAWGSMYPGGHVHIDTEDLRQRDFASMREMRDYLSQFGCCDVEWQLQAPGGVA